MRARVDELLGAFSITHLRDAPAHSLSGGERRRVEIARALAGSPSFLLLDEPFAGIDPMTLSDIRALVGRLKEEGLGLIVTDHNVRETLSLVDRALIIHEGRILKEGSPQEIVADEAVRRQYLGREFVL